MGSVNSDLLDDASLLQNEVKPYVPRRRRRPASNSKERGSPHYILWVAALLLLAAVISAAVLSSGRPHRQNSHRSAKTLDQRMIVAARLYGEDTSWLQTYFGDMPSVIVSAVDLPSYRRRCPIGHEDSWEDDCQTHVSAANGGAAAAYVQWIVSHYDRMPATVVFIHDHRNSIQRRHLLKHLKWDAAAFANLRHRGYSEQNCGAEACQQVADRVITPRRPTEATDLNPELTLLDKSAAVDAGMRLQRIWPWFQGALGTLPPERLRAPACCSEMMVAGTRISARPLKFWITLLGHLEEVSAADSPATMRAFEATWHVLFGEPPITLPVVKCRLYRCSQDEKVDTVTNTAIG